MTSSLTEPSGVVIGVDTHKNTHVAVAIDAVTGTRAGSLEINANGAGYRELVAWADTFDGSRCWGIEGTASYGKGLTDHLGDTEAIIEVERPARPARRGGRKNDDIDAERAAREVLAGTADAIPRCGQTRDALAQIVALRRSAVQAASDTARVFAATVLTAPEHLRSRLRGLTPDAQRQRVTHWSAHPNDDLITATTKNTLRTLAQRHHTLTAEAATTHRQITELVNSWRPDLLDNTGIGPITAAIILCAWSSPQRINTEAAFAMLAGVAPIPAHSGTTHRHRLNRHGDRQLNAALHTIIINRCRLDPATKAYCATATAKGKTRAEARRCLKRYLARAIYRQLQNPPPTP